MRGHDDQSRPNAARRSAACDDSRIASAPIVAATLGRRTALPSQRACIRYPSCLISWTLPSPSATAKIAGEWDWFR
jgi:hypothetical protein